MRSLLCLLILSVALFSGTAHAADNGAQRFHTSHHPVPARLLFVGNSYLYYNDSLHNHVERMVSALKPELREHLIYKSATIGGARLDQHNLDWLLGVGNIGVTQPFEMVVLQSDWMTPVSYL